MRATKPNVPALSDGYSSPLTQIVPVGKSVSHLLCVAA